MKKIILVLALWLLPSVAFAQCTGVFPASTVCGVTAAGPNVPGPLPLSSFALAPGGSSGQVQINNGSGGLGGLTNAQLTVLCQQFTSSLSGCVPASGGNAFTFLNGAGTFTNTSFGSYVSRGGTAQTWVPPVSNIYHIFQPLTVRYNQNSLFTASCAVGHSNDCFVPPTNTKIVHMDAQIWVTSGFLNNGSANWVIKWVKNATVDTNDNMLTAGTQLCTGIGSLTGFTTAIVMNAHCDDAPTAGDYYNLFMFIDSTTPGTATIIVDGNDAHTFTNFSVHN